MRRRTFISYASKDRDIAMTICTALETRGLKCWISCRDIHPGENFQEMIVKAIHSAGVMLLVFSANANNSDEIKKEIALASQSKLMVIPVRAEDVVPSDAFSYELATRQWVDLFGNWEQAMEELLAQIQYVVPDDGTAADPAAAQPVHEAQPSERHLALPHASPAAPAGWKHWLTIGGLIALGLLLAFVAPFMLGLYFIGLLAGAAIYWWRKSKRLSAEGSSVR